MQSPTHLPEGSLRPARGSLDLCARAGAGIHVGGWILHPDHVIDVAVVSINGNRVGECALTRREDLAAAFPHIPHAENSGFFVEGPAPDDSDAILHVTIEGRASGRPLLAFHWHARLRDADRTLPAEHLRLRVSGNTAATAFNQVGLDAAVTMMEAAQQHVRTTGGIRDALDWGCGSGRVTALMTELNPGVVIAGCDLDAEAIAWCNQHLRAGGFHATKPYPPLPFADQSFDAIFACSVMTHLQWSVQKRWLPEVRRLLRPGGVFVATVHGRFAAAFVPGEASRVDRSGIVEHLKDKALNGIAPRGYYRSVFQSEAFTRSHWSRELEIVDYREAGLAALQDLVVARKQR